MQTGKSHLIGPMISMLRDKYGDDAQFIVLSSARIITDQLGRDLVGQLKEKVGRFDGHHKDIQNVTVASAWSMARNLDQFALEKPVILINDEAYSTQAETFQKIYSHFGLGEIQKSDGR